MCESGLALGHISERTRYQSATKHPTGAAQSGIRGAGRNQHPVDVKTFSPPDIPEPGPLSRGKPRWMAVLNSTPRLPVAFEPGPVDTRQHATARTLHKCARWPRTAPHNGRRRARLQHPGETSAGAAAIAGRRDGPPPGDGNEGQGNELYKLPARQKRSAGPRDGGDHYAPERPDALPRKQQVSRSGQRLCPCFH